MLSNSLIMPLLINTGIVKAGASTAVDRLLLNIRRGSVALILLRAIFISKKSSVHIHWFQLVLSPFWQ